MKYSLAFLYVCLIVAANYTATMVIGNVYGTSVAVGTLFFGFVFTLRDHIHVQYGKLFIFKVIAVTIIVNLAFAFLQAFPLRIVIASIIAFTLSELADTEIFHRLKQKYWAYRVLSSNAVSIPLDTVLFTCIAFYGIWPNALILSVIIGDIIVKVITATSLIGLRKNDKINT